MAAFNPLKILHYASSAPFNCYDRQHEPACLSGTRVELLQNIYDWADGKDERGILWLTGLAGEGKTTIARTVAGRFFEQKRLGASFFFSKGGGDTSNAGKFVTSLAVQFASMPPLRQYITDAVKELSDVTNLSLLEQWRQLVLSPLSKLQGESCQSYFLVVDALDECEDDKDIQVILQLLSEARSLTTVRLRVFLTSRPEIHNMHYISQAEHQDLVLHRVPRTVVDHDILLFLEYNLEIIRREKYLAADWPGEEAVNKLVEYARGLFIWAAIACCFIRGVKVVRRFATRRLNIILDGSRSAEGDLGKHLNEIYLIILKFSIGSNYSWDRLKQTLGSMAVLLSPLSASSLSKILYLSEAEAIETTTNILANTSPYRLYHPSFRDFLLSKDRSNFCVDEKEAHRVLFDGCIQLMSQTLKKDICELHAPGYQATQVESSCVEKYIPPEVQYACLYWIQHLQRSGSQVRDSEEAHQFLKAHLLHWLEALGWMGKTAEGIQAILSLEAYIQESPKFHALVYDTMRFALYSQSVIVETPLQLYCSALVFAPEESTIHRTFIPPWLKTKVLQTLHRQNYQVFSIAFSPDGKQVVFGSSDNIVRLCNMATREQVPTMLEGHTERVSSVAFSADSKQVVSGSYDKTVRLWNVATGKQLRTLQGHTGWVSSVAFSPDGKKVACMSGDDAKLWDVTTGEQVLPTLEDQQDSVSSVALSTKHYVL